MTLLYDKLTTSGSLNGLLPHKEFYTSKNVNLDFIVLILQVKKDRI